MTNAEGAEKLGGGGEGGEIVERENGEETLEDDISGEVGKARSDCCRRFLSLHHGRLLTGRKMYPTSERIC